MAQVFKEALADVIRWRATASVEREVIVTPFDGAYGLAGYVFAVNGSPPRGVVVVLMENGAESEVWSMTIVGYDGRAQRVRKPEEYGRGSGGAQGRLWRAVEEMVRSGLVYVYLPGDGLADVGGV